MNAVEGGMETRDGKRKKWKNDEYKNCKIKNCGITEVCKNEKNVMLVCVFSWWISLKHLKQ